MDCLAEFPSPCFQDAPDMFGIRIEPAIDPSPRTYSDFALEQMNLSWIYENIKDEFSIIYSVDGEEFRYYASSVLTAINDIHRELESIKRHSSHGMTICGYTVLNMKFDNNMIRFCDPSPLNNPNNDLYIGSEFCPNDVEQIFKGALDALLYLVEKSCNRDDEI